MGIFGQRKGKGSSKEHKQPPPRRRSDYDDLRDMYPLLRLSDPVLRQMLLESDAGIVIEPNDTTMLVGAEQLRECMASCGWSDARNDIQQDSAEAFTFITETLAFPSLALTMHLAHGGVKNDESDYKVVTERLLHVPIPDEDVTLERCLQDYFSNQVNVKREVSEKKTSPGTIQAWQFFQLLPFFSTADIDSETAKFFESQNPIVSICLKRYITDTRGHAFKKNTLVYVPNVIDLPDFMATDTNISHRLVLYSAVCHRGNSIHSGHYVALSRDPLVSGRWLHFDDLRSFGAVSEAPPHILFQQEEP